MKCFVLAGGCGDALWPLSRRNYPKQFIEINKGRSLFQETIVRNLPFCDEFFIIANEKYENIIKGQMHAFQGLSYHLFLEQLGRQTAPAVAIAAMCVMPDEDILVVSTDHMIGEGDYNGAIVKAQKVLSDDCIVAIGCRSAKAENHREKGHHYFDVYQSGRMVYLPAEGNADARDDGVDQSDSRVARFQDSGILLVKAGTYLRAVRENKPSLYEACVTGRNRMEIRENSMIVTKEWLATIPSVSINEVVYLKWTESGRVKLVEGEFAWSRLLSLESVAEISAARLEASEKFTSGPQDIVYHCNDVSILNETEDKLVVVNDLSEVLVVNTKDAVYISRKGSSSEIKKIVEQNYNHRSESKAQGEEWDSESRVQSLFDESDIYYVAWGIKETLNRSSGYQVKKLTIFPGHSLSPHKHEKRSEHWSIVSGTATILMDGKEKEYQRNESIFVPVGTFHRIANYTAKDLIVVEVSIGESAGSNERDLIYMDELSAAGSAKMAKLLPVYKDYLWGGLSLNSLFGMGSCGEKIAESWVLSAHTDGVCRVLVQDNEADGQTVQESHEGIGQKQTCQRFDEYLAQVGRGALGWKCQPYERFPLLVKYIDAMRPLSIQVHPDDMYAMPVENDYGKNEMWYVLKAEPGAFVYLGFERDTTQEECRQRIQDGTLDEILHKVPVKEGDSVFVGAGTVHAINEGVVILEVQQSSNATYRLYDYNRTDKNGNLRPLHLEKAFANINLKANITDGRAMGEWEEERSCKKRLLQQCKYFSVIAYRVEEEMEISMDDSTFYSIVFVEGEGTILAGDTEMQYHAGDSFFIPAGKKMVKISGRAHFVLSHV